MNHRRYELTHSVCFFREGVASDDKTATKAVIEVANGVYMRRIEFEWPAERSRLSEVEKMLDLAFEKGRRDKAREVRETLHVEEPRR